VSDWFFMLGEPITPSERQRALDYLRGLGISDEFSVEGVSDWKDALRVITSPEWERSHWEAEQRERLRLQQAAESVHGAARVREVLSNTVAASESAHGMAAVAGARVECTDAGFIRAAAGAASEALYLAELAVLAGEVEQHPFIVKQALFAGGHWPLGAASGIYYIF
jgi:hypothetical protein